MILMVNKNWITFQEKKQTSRKEKKKMETQNQPKNPLYLNKSIAIMDL